MNSINYEYIWEEICYLLFDNISPTISERDFESNVIRCIEKLGWSEFKGEIKRQPIIPIGRQNSLRPDIVIYNSYGRAVIVIEIKKPNEDISKDDSINQIKSYMRQLKSDFGFLIGKEIRIYYDGNLNPQQDPLLIEKINFNKNSQTGINFSKLFYKNNFNINEYNDFLKKKIKKFNKEKEIEKLTNIITSKIMKDKILDFVKNELIDFSEEVIREVINNLSIQIIPKTNFTATTTQVKDDSNKLSYKTKEKEYSILKNERYSIEELKQRKLDKYDKPNSIIINGNKYTVKNWTDLIKIFIQYLINHKLINESDLPISNHAQKDKYFINSKKEHKDPKKDGSWITIGQFYIDTKYNAEHHKKNIIYLIEKLNCDLDLFINF